MIDFDLNYELSYSIGQVTRASGNGTLSIPNSQYLGTATVSA